MPPLRKNAYIVEVLHKLYELRDVHGPKLKIAEIGVEQANLASHILAWFPKCHIWGVDPWAPYDTGGEYKAKDARRGAKAWRQTRKLAERRVARHGPDRCTLMHMTSSEAAQVFRKDEIRFHLIFLDGLHTFTQLGCDVIDYYMLLLPGGRMGGHDLCDRTPGVQKALDHIERPYSKGLGDTWWYESLPIDQKPS
jgi:hypothetical protein